MITCSIGVFTFDHIEETIQATSINVPISLLLTFINAYIASISINALYAIGGEDSYNGGLNLLV